MIRRIRFDEASHVAVVYAHEYAPELSDKGKPPIVMWLQNCALHPHAFCLVAEEEGEIAGFVIAALTSSPVMPFHAGEVEELYVREADRGRGLGRALLEEAVARLRRDGARTVLAKAAPDEPEGKAFLEHLGFGPHAAVFALYDAV